MESLPQKYGLPQELDCSSIGGVNLPPGARSWGARIQPNNNPSIVSTFQSGTTASVILSDIAQQVQEIIWDIPCGGSPSTFIDNRVSTLNYQLNLACTTAGTTQVASINIRGSGYSFFDSNKTTGPSGNILDTINEKGLIANLLLQLQQSWSTREGLATMMGYSQSLQDAGQSGSRFAMTGAGATTQGEVINMSLPIMSTFMGVLGDRFPNVGRMRKLQHSITTSSVLPLTVAISATAGTTATYTLTLSNFSLQLEYVDIGPEGLRHYDAMLPQNALGHKAAFTHGTSYKCTTANMINTAGTQMVPISIPGTSVKSVFVGFAENAANHVTTGSANGKYDSKNPMLTSFGFNVGGQVFPQSGPINCLLAPSQCMANLQQAAGNFNSSQFQSSLIADYYCRASASSLAASLPAVTPTLNYIDSRYNAGTSAAYMSNFYLGQSFDVIARRGIRSGVNLQSAKCFLNLVNLALTNSQTVYVMSMIDTFFEHDVETWDVKAYV